MDIIEALNELSATERRDRAFMGDRLSVHCAGIDLERLQDFQALHGRWKAGRTFGASKVRSYRKLRRAVLKRAII